MRDDLRRVLAVEEIRPALRRQRLPVLEQRRVLQEQPRVPAQIPALRHNEARLAGGDLPDQLAQVRVGEERPELAGRHRLTIAQNVHHSMTTGSASVLPSGDLSTTW